MILGSVGLATGVLCAAVAPFLPLESVVDAPASHLSRAYESIISITYDWSPSPAILPASGLLFGLVVGVALHLGGWRLRRA
ncbi:hypothetical protein [Pseudonocardia oroxyli]|uniref:Uncharacterized protein n=1 Tax=Pseudonocardia oroxyli TaxID=366584 RepID=A0A1G8ACA5_PSEOR|nr:hypothetical protein [Pseudonocardia oroxyli]SDH18578.1 hypothetical protein SAMN05216377_1202 [Pseudonocardia oroxyli]